LKMVDIPSYLSGYVDGEGCFTVSIAPRPTLRVGLGSATEPVGQPKWRPVRGTADNAGLFRIGDHKAGPERQDIKVGGS
jgi:hypothetical protein